MILAEIEDYCVSNVTQTVADGSRQFTIGNGMVLQGYPREKTDDAAFEWPDEDVQYVDRELFKANAHFFFENRERIFADSGMFLAPVNVISGAAYSSHPTNHEPRITNHCPITRLHLIRPFWYNVRQ